MSGTAKAAELEIAQIAAVSIEGTSAIKLRLLDQDRREWIIKLPFEVLYVCLRRVSGDRDLVLCAETLEDHAKITYPKRSWEFFRDSASREPTFSCRTADGYGLEIGFNIDPLTATPTVAVTIAAG